MASLNFTTSVRGRPPVFPRAFADARPAEARSARAAGQTGHGLARRNYDLLQLLLQTGLRVGEASRLVIADCEICNRSGLVRVRAGKGGKEREVPLNASVRRAVALYLTMREDYTQSLCF